MESLWKTFGKACQTLFEPRHFGFSHQPSKFSPNKQKMRSQTCLPPNFLPEGEQVRALIFRRRPFPLGAVHHAAGARKGARRSLLRCGGHSAPLGGQGGREFQQRHHAAVALAPIGMWPHGNNGAVSRICREAPRCASRRPRIVDKAAGSALQLAVHGAVPGGAITLGNTRTILFHIGVGATICGPQGWVCGVAEA